MVEIDEESILRNDPVEIILGFPDGKTKTINYRNMSRRNFRQVGKIIGSLQDYAANVFQGIDGNANIFEVIFEILEQLIDVADREVGKMILLAYPEITEEELEDLSLPQIMFLVKNFWDKDFVLVKNSMSGTGLLPTFLGSMARTVIGARPNENGNEPIGNSSGEQDFVPQQKEKKQIRRRPRATK